MTGFGAAHGLPFFRGPVGPSGFYRPVTVQSSLVDGTHTSFPTLVYFSDPTLATVANGGKVQNADGYDIRFYLDQTLGTIKTWDMESYNPVTGEGWAWVLLDIDDVADEAFVMVYGDASITTYQSVKSDVWTAYSGVWHLSEASGNAVDSTANGNHLTDTNTVGAATGKINGARDFERSSGEFFTRADNASLSTGDIDFEMQMWVNFESVPVDSVMNIAGKRKAFTNNLEYYVRHVRGFGFDCFNFEVSSNGTAGSLGDVNATAFGLASPGTPYCIFAWHDSVNNQLGISINNNEFTSSYSGGVFDGVASFDIGTSDATAVEAVDGLIDEVRLLKAAPSANRRSTTYANQNSPATFAVVGSELPL